MSGRNQRDPCRMRTDRPGKPPGNGGLRCDLKRGHDGPRMAGYTENGQKRKISFGYSV